jgi:GDP-L-fucose synthase
MKILITGGSGLVGSAIKTIQHEFNDYELITPSSQLYNLLEYIDADQMIYEHKPDWVVHLAANVGGLYKNMNQPVEMFEENMLMNMNVVRACHDNGVKNFVGCLSTCIFPDSINYPIDESQLHHGPPHESNAPYAHAKRMLQVQCDAYNKKYNHNYNCIIPTNVYGENDNYQLENSHVIPGLIHRCYLAKQDDKPFVVRGTGNVLRQFIHAEDLARAIMKLLPVIKQDTVIVADDQTEVTIKSVAEIIADQFEYKQHMTFDTSYSDGQYKKTADSSKLMNMLPKMNFRSLDQGIKQTVNHFINNYDKLRK